MLSIIISEEMSSMVNNIVKKVVRHCGVRHNFDAELMIRELNLDDISVSVSLSKEKVVKEKVVKEKNAVKEKVLVVKSKYPMPFCGTVKEGCCGALRQNHSLYTQCETIVNCDETYCKKCGENPQYGTIQQRLEVGLMEFRDPKGKSPIHFTKVMKKLKISREDVEEEAGKLNIIINPIHFEEEKVEKKEKGRPKKAKKIVELEDNSTDLFAALVAKANEDSEEEEDSESESEDEKVSIAESIMDTVLEKVSVTVENNEKKAEKDAEKLAEKALKDAEKLAEKEALLQKKEAEKALKEAEKLAEKQKKEAEKALKEAEKLAEKQKKEAEKAEKDAEKLAAKQKKESEKKPVLVKAVEVKALPVKAVAVKAVAVKKAKVEEEEEDVVKRFEFEGVKYLKSKKTGIIYNMEQDVIGKWNDKTGKIDFEEAGSEEEEEEYEE
jgi:chemotaxis protein histidine kinase CheA